ncbi:ABC transporter permease [uncultured Serratia sp.]|uniref:ABC transporter permease n=1 Tax=uncultured Serratia sp. TaxID=239175 RepID=UPI002584D8DB|nr:ABC transporter permease [uncultured Serratia sp.]
MKTLLKNTGLIFNLTKRDVESRYRGTSLGIVWSLLNPVIMLSIYSFIFGFVFKAKWGLTTTENYTLIMFTGLLTHGFIAECLGKATTIYVYNVSYVKKVLFPLESLCWVSVFGSLFQFFMGCIVFAIFCILLKQPVSLMALLVPIVILPLILLSYSISLFLSSLGVYIRDMGQVVSVIIALMLFMSPIFYPITAVPEQYRMLIYINPLTFIVEALRDVVLYGKLFSLEGYALYWGISIVLYVLAITWFKKVKRGFADVL